MKEYICIVCPNGCHLRYDEVNDICEGNRCPRGKEYARDEFSHPKRSVTSSVRTTVDGYPVISVRTSKDIDKELIPALLIELKKALVTEKLGMNAVVIKNVLNTDVDIITTTSMQ